MWSQVPTYSEMCPRGPYTFTVSTPVRVRAERVEVRRSREAILAAAEKHYTVHEFDPSMSELAKLAGVGNATLYRRYPSIDDVIRELYTRLLGELQELEPVILAQPTGWDAIVALVMGIVETLDAHPALARLNRRAVAIDNDQRLSSLWDDKLAQIVAWAQAEGTLRPDVNHHDITFAAFRFGYSNLPPDERDRVLGRQVGIILDGLRADGRRTELPGGVITGQDLHQIFRYEVENPRD